MKRNARPLGGADASGIPLVLPDDAYFRSAWQRQDGSLVPAPAAPETVRNVWYGDVSVIRGPEQRDDPLALRAPDLEPAGTVSRARLESDTLGQVRRVAVYTPADTRPDAELPLILVQDGTAFLRVGLLPAIMDQLAAEGVPPARLVFLEPADRDSAYSFSSASPSFRPGEP